MKKGNAPSDAALEKVVSLSMDRKSVLDSQSLTIWFHQPIRR
ncbi:hypothetical protein [Allobaculum mucilyticum]|nr:hypothetical protein [Allobaculum mucilyticum]